MEANIKLSIICPVYNTERYLSETLDSVFSQTFKNFELIIVDDGSTDNSLSILHDYRTQNENITIITITHSGKAGRPRNIGLDMAQGEYVFFLDSDDKLDNKAMERAIATADETHSDTVLLRMESFGTGQRKIPSKAFKKNWLQADFIDSAACETLTSLKLFRRNIIEKNHIRFPETYACGEDQPFVLKSYLFGNHISIISDKVYYWVRNRGNSSAPEQGGHLVTATQSLQQELLKITTPAQVVSEHMQPGYRRDKVMERIFTAPDGLASIFNKRFLALNRSEQTKFIREINKFSHLWSEGLRTNTRKRSRRNLLDAIFSKNRKKIIISIIKSEIRQIYRYLRGKNRD